MSNNIDSLKIAAINVNSLIKYNRRLELNQFISNNDLDIVLVSETKLNKKHKISIPKYRVIRTDRTKTDGGGGTAIIIKNEIEYTVIQNPNSKHNQILEYTLICLKLNSKQNLTIGSIYATTKTEDTNQFLKEINHLFKEL